MARAVVGNLPTPINLDNRYITGGQHVLCLAGLPLGKYPRVLQQPQFIRGIVGTRISEILHSLQRGRVVHQAQLANDQWWQRH